MKTIHIKYNGPTPPRQLTDGIEDIHSYMAKGDYASAGGILQRLEERYREHPVLISVAYNYYLDTQNMRELERVCVALQALQRNDPDIALSLARAHLANNRQGLGRKTLLNFLRRWPNHEAAEETKTMIEEIERSIVLDAVPGVSEKDLLDELSILHDEVRYALEHQLFSQGRKQAERLLKKYPTFAPALNNLSQIYYLEGNMPRSLELCNKVLEIAADNIHALSNLTRLLCVLGKETEARQMAERLKSSNARAADKYIKIMEALGFLGDDEETIRVYKQAKEANELEGALFAPICHHLAAVAYANQGNEHKAKALWKEALEMDADFDLARGNLDDLKLPRHERNGAWAYPVEYWLPYFQSEIKAMAGIDSKRIIKSFEQFIARHPEIIRIAPALYQRGDRFARESLIKMTAISEDKLLLEATTAFALGQKGADELRIQAAQVASSRHCIPAGNTRMWINGEWREIMMLGFQLSGDAKAQMPKDVEDVYKKSAQALYDEDGAKAAGILEEAVRRFPDNAPLFNNLAVAYEMQGKTEQAEKMIDEMAEKFPDYFFGIVARARRAMRAKDYALAHTLLETAMRRETLHFSEFESLCAINVELAEEEDAPDTARQWLDMWEQAMPKSPILQEYKDMRMGDSARPVRQRGAWPRRPN